MEDGEEYRMFPLAGFQRLDNMGQGQQIQREYTTSEQRSRIHTSASKSEGMRINEPIGKKSLYNQL